MYLKGYFLNIVNSLTCLVALALLVVVSAGAAADETPRLNTAIKRLADGQPALGIFSANRDVMNARMLSRSGLDYLIVDMEHAPLDFETARAFIHGLRDASGSFPVAPIVRLAANGREILVNQWMVKQALDMGAFGIMVPHINTAEQAYNAVVAMRYPPPKDHAAPEPKGQRGWAPYIAAGTWGLAMAEYAAVADLWPLSETGELLLVVQIETIESIRNLREILSVPGVGAAFIGPADLHADMGYLGQSGIAAVEDEIQKALAIAVDVGVPIGITTNADTAPQRLSEGFTFITVGFDASLGGGIQAAMEAVGR